MSRHHHERSEHGEHTPECQALLAELGDYIDGELEQTLCAEIEQHLAHCDDCRVLVDTTQKTITLYRRQTPVELPEGALSRLRRALDDAGWRAGE